MPDIVHMYLSLYYALDRSRFKTSVRSVIANSKRTYFMHYIRLNRAKIQTAAATEDIITIIYISFKFIIRPFSLESYEKIWQKTATNKKPEWVVLCGSYSDFDPVNLHSLRIKLFSLRIGIHNVFFFGIATSILYFEWNFRLYSVMRWKM